MTRSTLVAVLVTLCTVSAAHAQDTSFRAAPEQTQNPPAQAGTAVAPPTTGTTNPYMTSIRLALEHLADADYDATFAQLRQAASFSSDEPLAYYLLGELHRLRNSVPDALEMFRTASRLADSGTDFQMQGRARLAIAQCLEQIDGHMDEARTAWMEYVRFAEAHPTVATAEWGRTRLQSIDVAHEQEDVYVGVRQRITARAQELTRAAAAARNAPAPAPRPGARR